MRRVSNPPNPWASTAVEWLDLPPAATPTVYEEDARSILNPNTSPDLPFALSANAYRGCGHACAYCYARPTHEYLDLGAGTDFETRLVVKRNAPELLSIELASPRRRGRVVALSGNTDPYQPLEAGYGLTRAMLGVFLERSTPVCLITKGALVRRDLDLLARLAERDLVRVHVSIPFADTALARALEPGAPTPAKRFEVMRALADAGVPVGISLAPLIPGLNEDQLAGLLARAAEAGARTAFTALLRLPGSSREVFFERIEARLPERVARIRSALLEARGGKLHEGRFGLRMSGKGPRYRAAMDLFELAARRHGLELGEAAGSRFDVPDRDHAPGAPRQGELFAG